MNTSILQTMILALPSLANLHAPESIVYRLLKQVARKEIEGAFAEGSQTAREFGPFGPLVFPYHRMGAVDSLNLFDLDELIIFSFYWANRARYHRVLDIGANLGLHSIILSKCGFEVRAFEPDPQHFAVLRQNLALNGCTSVHALNAAVSRSAGVMEFVRVLGNTTGSHLAGSKANPYGDLERFPVQVEAIRSVLPWADLLKIDAEGHEKEILLATDRDHWLGRDALVEVSTASNAALLYEHFSALGVTLFSQKNGWCKVDSLEHMPNSHHEGTLFVAGSGEMHWS